MKYVVFINGICTDESTSKNYADDIHSFLVRERGSADGLHTSHRHNPTAPDERVVKMIAQGTVGAAGVTHGVRAALNEDRPWWERTLGGVAALLGAGSLCAAKSEYDALQDDKDVLADELKCIFEELLAKSHTHTLTLVLHSQGADVGGRVLKRMPPHLRHQIRAVTLGPMIPMSASRAAMVYNFQFDGDFTSIAACTVFSHDLTPGEESPEIIELQQGSHAVRDYLDDDRVQEALLQCIK